MDGEIDFSGPVPPWRQLYLILRADIESGKIPAGRAIPSRRTLHEMYGLAIPTITKAINELKADGLIVPVKGMGLFVVDKNER
jgi:DNA-binding GntR family transcriptional regulator